MKPPSGGRVSNPTRRLAESADRDVKGTDGGHQEYSSPGAGPATPSRTAAVSRTERVNTNSWFMRLVDVAPMGTRPGVGLKPITPHQAAGSLIEPRPSLPCAIGTSPAATAAADPPEDPLGDRSGFHGFRVGPKVRGWVVVWAPISGVRGAVLSQGSVQVGERQRARERVGLLARAQLGDRPHRRRDPGGVAGQRHRPQRLVLALDVVDEVLVVGPPQDEHPLRGGSPVIPWLARCVLRNVAARRCPPL